ncbi:carbohydrate-binding protein [Streptomyces actinomycinicus]|uniref:carbohydrate-binding protein n=1 Tax=Streptomyces actinomycinicus TaxID=1695166 RepID=UPI0035562B12
MPGTPSGGTSPGTPGSGGTSSGNSGGPIGGSGICATPAWVQETIYTSGNVVSRNGRVWRAKWWTRGNEPGGPTAYGAWEDEGAC